MGEKGGCDMLNIAVVEDNRQDMEQLLSYIERYSREKGAELQTSSFLDGGELLEDYQARYDIIFLDIEMPGLNGMDLARQLRTRDSNVVLVFVTQIAQYAIQGYSVGALDYVLKPVSYRTFSVKLERAMGLARRRASSQILVRQSDGVLRLDTRQVYYIDVHDRMLHYHTELGDFATRETLQSVEEKLAPFHFVRGNHWYIVNLYHVSGVRDDKVIVNGQELMLSRRNKAAFLSALASYVGGGA